MKCADCEHLKVVYPPIRGPFGCIELGRARCMKHDLIADFTNMTKFRKMDCQGESEGENETSGDKCS